MITISLYDLEPFITGIRIKMQDKNKTVKNVRIFFI